MKRILYCLLFSGCWATSSFAQVKGQWQLFTGYSYMRANVREYFKSTPIVYSIRNQHANLNGWDVSITENVNRWFGGTLDASGHYGAPSVLGTTTTQRAHSILYGPRFSYQGRSFRPFAHVLLGVTHISAQVSSTGPHVADTSFTAAPGGGVDIRLYSKGSIRLIQAEYFRTNFQGGSQNQLRLSSGIAFDLNRK